MFSNLVSLEIFGSVCMRVVVSSVVRLFIFVKVERVDEMEWFEFNNGVFGLESGMMWLCSICVLIFLMLSFFRFWLILLMCFLYWII